MLLQILTSWIALNTPDTISGFLSACWETQEPLITTIKYSVTSKKLWRPRRCQYEAREPNRPICFLIMLISESHQLICAPGCSVFLRYVSLHIGRSNSERDQRWGLKALKGWFNKWAAHRTEVIMRCWRTDHMDGRDRDPRVQRLALITTSPPLAGPADDHTRCSGFTARL